MVVQSPLLFHFKSQYHRRGRHLKCKHKTLQGNFRDIADRTSDKIIDKMVNVQGFNSGSSQEWTLSRWSIMISLSTISRNWNLRPLLKTSSVASACTRISSTTISYSTWSISLEMSNWNMTWKTTLKGWKCFEQTQTVTSQTTGCFGARSHWKLIPRSWLSKISWIRSGKSALQFLLADFILDLRF